MTKEEVLKNAKENKWFLRDRPEWNNDIILIAVQQNGLALEYVSDK